RDVRRQAGEARCLRHLGLEARRQRLDVRPAHGVAEGRPLRPRPDGRPQRQLAIAFRATFTAGSPSGGPASLCSNGPTMILPKVRDPRFITVRRGGSLSDDDHHLLALWAADCAEHVLGLFEVGRPDDDRPRRAIEMGRGWARGEVSWWDARAAGGYA